MEHNDENELRDFLLLYKINPPSSEVVNRTKRFMREEMVKISPDLTWQGRWIFMLVSLSLILSMCIFYLLTVETIFSLILPSYMFNFLYHSIFVFVLTIGGACFLIGLFINLCIQFFQWQVLPSISQWHWKCRLQKIFYTQSSIVWPW